METEERLARLQLNLEDKEYFRNHILSGPADKTYKPELQAKSAIRPSNKRLLQASTLVTQFLDDLLKPSRHEHHASTLAKWVKFVEHKTTVVVEQWSRLSEQIFRVDKWSVCQG